MNDYCDHCPVEKHASGLSCLGRTAIGPHPAIGRYCELVDPNDAGYVPGYGASVLQASAEAASSAATDSAEYPSLGKMAMNLAKAAVAFATDGFHTVDDAEFNRRLVICAACEQFDPGPIRCKHPDCGCFMGLKARGRSMECPLGKWTIEPQPAPSS